MGVYHALPVIARFRRNRGNLVLYRESCILHRVRRSGFQPRCLLRTKIWLRVFEGTDNAIISELIVSELKVVLIPCASSVGLRPGACLTGSHGKYAVYIRPLIGRGMFQENQRLKSIPNAAIAFSRLLKTSDARSKIHF